MSFISQVLERNSTTTQLEAAAIAPDSKSELGNIREHIARPAIPELVTDSVPKGSNQH